MLQRIHNIVKTVLGSLLKKSNALLVRFLKSNAV